MDKDKFLKAWRDMARDIGDHNYVPKNGDEDYLVTRIIANRMMAIARQMELNRPNESVVFKIDETLTYVIPVN